MLCRGGECKLLYGSSADWTGPMSMNRVFRSLRFKVTVGVLFALLVILSILFYVRHTSYERLLVDNLQALAANAGEIIEGSLQLAMVTNDFSMLQQVADDIGEQPGVQDLFLLSKSGHVLISTDDNMIDTTIERDDETCQACHSYVAASRNESVVLALEGGVRIFRNVNAIENGDECTGCHDASTPILGVLISDFDMSPVQSALLIDRRNSLLWSAGSIVLALVAVDLLMSRMVMARLEQLVSVIKRVDGGDLSARVSDRGSDEIGELVGAFNRMTEGLKEKAKLEQSLKEQTQVLQAQTGRLAALNTIAATVSQSLDIKEILDSALDKVLELIDLRACWVLLRHEESEDLELVASRGLPAEIAHAHVNCAWNRSVCSRVLDLGQPRVFEEGFDHACPTAEYFEQEGLAFRTCVPLTSRERVLGVMTLVGDAFAQPPLAGLGGQPSRTAKRVSTMRTRGPTSGVLTEDTVELLAAIGRQMGIAIENASLYAELRQEETLRRHLVERLLTAQEEERKRIALELHDQTGQPLTSLIMTLGVLAEARSVAEVQEHVQDLRDTAAQVLKEVHDLALELRPSVLDDLGLLAALRHLHKEYQDRFRLPVDFQVLGLEDGRLPSEVETTLYRIVQEALTNVARHAQAESVSVLLERREHSVMLIVEDDGQGFDAVDVTHPVSHSRDRLGLYGMRERALLLGGELTIESTPGTGTAVFVEIPVEPGGEG